MQKKVNIILNGSVNSGKTHTLFGSRKNPGILQMTLETIFGYIENTPKNEYVIKVAFFEIYNESVNDLISSDNKNLQILDSDNGSYIKDLNEKIISKVSQVIEILHSGEKIKFHNVMSKSDKKAKSHSIFRIIIESRLRNSDKNMQSEIRQTTINLIKLSNSENMTDPSLSLFWGAIQKLSQSDISHKKPIIHYKDSKLTKYLQKSLEGNCKTIFITTISPTFTQNDDNINAISLCIKAKNIQFNPKCEILSKNEILESTFSKLEYKIMTLKQKLAQANFKNENEQSLVKMLEEIKRQILTSGEIDLTDENLNNTISDNLTEISGETPIFDLTEEMERKLMPAERIEKRIQKYKKFKGSDSEQESPLLSHEIIKPRENFNQTNFNLTNKPEELILPEVKEELKITEKPQSKEKEKELKEILANSEKKFFDELVIDYSKQMKVFFLDEIVLGITTRSKSIRNSKKIIIG